MAVEQCFLAWVILFHGKHLTMSGDIFSVTTGVGMLPLAPAGSGSSTRRYTGWLLTTPKDYLAPRSIVWRLRHPLLGMSEVIQSHFLPCRCYSAKLTRSCYEFVKLTALFFLAEFRKMFLNTHSGSTRKCGQ